MQVLCIGTSLWAISLLLVCSNSPPIKNGNVTTLSKPHVHAVTFLEDYVLDNFNQDIVHPVETLFGLRPTKGNLVGRNHGATLLIALKGAARFWAV